MFDENIDNVVEEAQASFDLKERLRGRATRKTQKVTVFLDEAAAEELGGTREIRGQFGFITDKESFGVLGDIERLKSDDAANHSAEIALLEKRAEDLRKTIESSSIEFTLGYVPPIIRDDARRKAKKDLGIKGKDLTDEQEAQIRVQNFAHLMAAATQSYIDRQSGVTVNELSVEDAVALGNYLPDSEFQRLDAALYDLLFKSVITEQIVDSADF